MTPEERLDMIVTLFYFGVIWFSLSATFLWAADKIEKWWERRW